MQNITTIFYAPTENFFKGHVQLPQDESHHMVKVLRFSVDDQFVVTDGKSKVHLAKLSKADSRRAVGDILHDEELPPLSGELPINVAIAVGIIRPKRFEKLLSPLSQLGSTEIIPVITKYSDISHNKRIGGDQFHERLCKMVRNYAKGSLRTRFPVLYKPMNLLETLENWHNRKIIFGDPEGLPSIPRFQGEDKRDILLVVGPEGGFSHRELETMTDMNAIPLSLGRTRLRTENAAATILVKALNNLGML